MLLKNELEMKSKIGEIVKKTLKFGVCSLLFGVEGPWFEV